MLRPVEKNDTKILFEWRNDPDTRASSVNTEPLKWEDHLNWLNKTLHNPDRQLFVFLSEGLPAGTCRVDKETEDVFELSSTIAPEFPGKGLGKVMLQELLEHQSLAGKRKKAVIKPDNIASLKMVEHFGFKRGSDSDGLAVWYLD